MTDEESNFLKEWPRAVTKDLREIYNQLRRAHMAITFMLFTNLGILVATFFLASKMK